MIQGEQSYADIVLYGPAETLTCSECGMPYVSRGKYDPGRCYSCIEKEMMTKIKLKGGPLDGQEN